MPIWHFKPMGTQFVLDRTGIVKHIVDEPVQLLHKFEKKVKDLLCASAGRPSASTGIANNWD